MTPACSTCKYWHPRMDMVEMGECRRTAPQGARSLTLLADGPPAYRAAWCITEGTDWCGEHEGKVA